MRLPDRDAGPPAPSDPLLPRGGVGRWFADRTAHLHPSLTAVAVGIAGALVLVVVLGAAGLVVAAGPLSGLDDQVAAAVRQARTPTWTSIASAVTRATEAWTVLGVVLGVAGCRVVLGLHHLSDVVAGVVLGGASLAVGVVVARALPLAPVAAEVGRPPRARVA